MPTYQIQVQIAVRALVPTVAKVEDQINESMRDFGFTERISYRSVLPLTITTERPLTIPEMGTVRDTVAEQFKIHQPDWEAHVGDIHRLD